MATLKTSNIKPKLKPETIVILLVVLAVVAIGTYLLLNARAATPFVGSEPEAGAASKGATAGSDAAASGGKYIKFAKPIDIPVGGAGAAAWITKYLEGADVRTGVASGRKNVETPVLFKDYTATGGKYMVNAIDSAAPLEKRVGIINAKFTDSVSPDIYGAGLYNSNEANGAGMKWYLKNVLVEPNWPIWAGYSKTNYDGITLNNQGNVGTEFYAEDLTVRKWHADAGIDNKSGVSQFVRLIVEGPGHRSLRMWKPGPHYLVDSRIDNPGTAGSGNVMWISDCATADIRIWNSTFNGSRTVPSNKVECNSNGPAKFTYLTKDPRTTGEMHPMFSTK